jgi:hypothetical protein
MGAERRAVANLTLKQDGHARVWDGGARAGANRHSSRGTGDRYERVERVDT